MAHINLLPWRIELRKEREKRFAAITGIAVAISALLFAALHFYVAAMIDYQNERNNFLKEEIKKAEEQIEEIKELEAKRDRLFARMKIIQELQASRPEVVHLFDELVTSLPDGVYYTSMTQKERKITLEGKAQSNARVATLMRQLEASEWLKVSRLDIIEIPSKSKGEQGAAKFGKFVLKVEQEAPKPPDDSENGGMEDFSSSQEGGK